MPVRNSNFQNSARPDLATQIVQTLAPTTFYSLLCQRRQFTLEHVLEDKLLGKYVVITLHKSLNKISSEKY